MKTEIAKTLFSVSRWLKGLNGGAHCEEESKEEEQSTTPALDAVEELLSCSDLSSNALSDEALSSSSCYNGWDGSTRGTGSTGCSLSPQLPMPPYFMSCIGKIQEELKVVMSTFPSDTASTVLCHALGYILQTKWNWQVKFCCQSKDARLPHTMPSSWVEDVMIVMPAERMHCVIDLNFRDKFVIRCSGSLGEKYATDVLQHIPPVYVGSLNQLFKDIDTWTAAIEQVFRGNALTLPPWRTRRSFQQLYKFCVECDATESNSCLRRIGSQLSIGGEMWSPIEEECNGAGCRVGSHYLEYFRRAFMVSKCASAVEFSASELYNSEPMDYNFEKEESPIVSVNTDHSGLSFLLNSR